VGSGRWKVGEPSGAPPGLPTSDFTLKTAAKPPCETKPICVLAPNPPARYNSYATRRGVGVADRAGFENQCALTGTAGSNPALSVFLPRLVRRTKERTQRPSQRSPEEPIRRPGSTRRAEASGLVFARSTRLNIRVAKGIRPRRTMATHSGSTFIHAML
jgi:hypothetical protein